MRVALLALVSALGAAAPASADTFIVDNGGDGNLATCSTAADDCTLRGALDDANATAGPNTIMLPALRIELTSPLPVISAPLTIQGVSARSSIVDGTGNVGSVFASKFGSNTTLQDLQVTGAGRVPGDQDAAVQSPARLERVAIIDNQSIGVTTSGGATILDSLIARNTGEGVGGIEVTGSASISNSTIADNTAVLSGVPPLAGPLVWSGGVINAAGLLEIDHSTIAGNKIVAEATLLTGMNLGSIGALTLSTVVRSSVIGGSLAPNCGGPINSNGHNIDSDGSCRFTSAGDRSNVDPMLAPLADNGGPTDTIALLRGSPAIDAGDACPATDQRGQSRAQGAGCDAGALESPFTTPAPATTPPATTPTTTATTPGPPPPRDTTPPRLTIAGVAKTVRRKALRAGLKVRIGANEPVAAELELLIAPRHVTIARVPDLAIATLSLARAAGTRTVKLNPARPLTGTRPVPGQLRVIAYDAAGNRSAKTINFTIR